MRKIFLFLPLVLVTLNLNAQKIHLIADAPQRAEAEKHFTVKYIINTVLEGNVTPSLSGLDGFEVVNGSYVSNTSSTTITNGKVVSSNNTVFTYVFMVPKGGVYTIPCLTIKTELGEYYSNPLPITILEKKMIPQ
ncbi:MAG: BatD family protein [Prevotellaceae bacterium]|jgi:hypothetical protein|nr:BatD family protein [Prevotellaceae bacterium]